MIRLIARASAVLAAAGLVGVAALPAFAHVTVHTDTPMRGASDAAVMFRTPNEESNSATVKLQVFFPTTHPLLDVLVEPHPGWHFTTKTKQLAHPVTTDDGPITSAVSQVTWLANSTAAGLQPGEATDFVVIAGELPDTATVTFRALQTYSNGDVVKWIEIQAPGAQEPEHPAPVLHLQPSTSTGSAGSSSSSDQSTSAASNSASASSDDGTGRALAVVALVIAIVAVGIAVFGLRRRS
jgi:periplasmic copper chaperone A